MRLLICAGGTGGGVYPALSVLQAVMSKLPSSPLAGQVLWVGSQGGMEAGLVQRAGVPFEAIPAAPVAGINPLRLPGNLWKTLRGVRAAGRLLDNFKPDVILFTGGFVGVPMSIAARMRRVPVPTLLYVPDIEPGMALKFQARSADCIALTTEASRAYFPAGKRTQVTGYPLRPELANYKRESARSHLNLSAECPVLLVFGGSKGARSINRALLAGLPELLNLFQVVHISGELDWPEVQSAGDTLPADLVKQYHPYPYLHEEMGAALAAADLAVSRAGAAALGEFPFFGLPAVLVPYPYAWRYQKVNADYLVQRGGAIMLRNEDLAEQLLPTLKGLTQDRLQAMSQAMRQLSRPGAAQAVADLLVELSAKHSEAAHD